MSRLMRNMMARYMAPAGEEGASGGDIDRGDAFVPSEDGEGAETASAALTDEEKEAERAALGLGAAKPAQTGAEPTAEEAEAAAAALAAAEKGKKDTRIPLARHTEILGRERAAREVLEAEVANLKQGQRAAETNTEIAKLEDKIVALEEKYSEALIAGNTKEAASLMKEIRQSERAAIEQKAEFRTQVATANAVEQVRFDATVDRLELAYPQLQPGHETFDKELVAEVLELQSAFQLKGLTPSAALQKAVGYVIKPVSSKQEAATAVVPRVTDSDAAAALKTAREIEARKRGASAAGAQPAALGKTGANSDGAGGVLDAKTAIKMPFEKFKDLSEEDLGRMRGDIV